MHTWMYLLYLNLPVTFLMALAATKTLRYMHLLMDGALAEIFSQIQTAELHASFWIPLILTSIVIIAVGLLLSFLPKAVYHVLLWAALILTPYITSLMLTKVNGVRFCDILFPLLETIKNGGLEALG
ncbi:MAG: hypothetical protein IJ493_01720 [Clostridia bacterium]|nr:hypothetical protein [Clostridia bacterium]